MNDPESTIPGGATDKLVGQFPETIAGTRYRVSRLLGEGGQKRVYLAHDTRLDRDVAVSLLKTSLDAEGAARFAREAQTMGRLGEHPNIVTIYDIGDMEGRPYVVSQYVEGGSLAELLASTGRRPLSLPQLLDLATQVCNALAHIHERGIVHRDLKPGNIWLGNQGKAKIGDFGLAIGIDFATITMKGTLVGTVAYLPPEVALGLEARPQSDLYSLGVILYEMATGRRPFQGDHLMGVISQHINTPPVAPSWHNPEIPRALEMLILKMLAKAPEERPESAAEVANALAGIGSQRAAPDDDGHAPDSRSLARLAMGVFVGRASETEHLRNSLNHAVTQDGRLIMLAGEPGSGKTRMVEQLATYARLRGIQVLTGKCYEGEGAPAFWPWVQVIRAYVQDHSAEDLRAMMGPGVIDIAQIAPAIREKLPDLPEAPVLEPAQARFRLFDSITTFLKHESRERPMLIVLDDLHWADKPSLLLLQFLSRELRETRLLVVGTYREQEVDQKHPLAEALGEMARQGPIERLQLSGLSEAEVAQFIELTAGIDAPDRLAAAVYKTTEGNPFFVNEIVRLLVAEGQLSRTDLSGMFTLGIPRGVREVIGRRLDRLPPDCHRLLTLAAVVGRDFSFSVLAPLSGIGEERLLEALDEAVAARVVVEVPRAAGQYSFAHALIRETLYDELTAARRVRLHKNVGEALEKTYAKSLDTHLPELAYHFHQAVAEGEASEVSRAIHYAERAAKRATALLGYEDAAAAYERAIDALSRKRELTPRDEERQIQLTLSMGEAQIKAGNLAAARQTFQRAAELARKIGAKGALARAALGFSTNLTGPAGRVDEPVLEILRDALATLGDGDSALRAKLLAQLSQALYYEPELRDRHSREAVEMARRVGNPEALAAALYARHMAMAGTVNVPERLAAATEMLRLAETTNQGELALRAHYRRFLDLLELTAVEAADLEAEACIQLSQELRQPRYLWLTVSLTASRELLKGHFDEAERLSQQVLAIGRRVQDPAAALSFGVLLVNIRVGQGRSRELIAMVSDWLEKYPQIPGTRTTLAWLFSHLGDRTQARQAFEASFAHDLKDLPRDGSWVTVLGSLAYACYFLGDVRRAGTLYELLLPYSGRCVVIGSSGVCVGATSLALGLLSEVLSRTDDAARHYEDAIELNSRIMAAPYAAESRYAYARMLVSRNGEGDIRRARELLADSLSTAETLGMVRLVERVRLLQEKSAQDEATEVN
jgi:eukaryotic-like serine/threonine-protein kinase